MFCHYFQNHLFRNLKVFSSVPSPAYTTVLQTMLALSCILLNISVSSCWSKWEVQYFLECPFTNSKKLWMLDCSFYLVLFCRCLSCVCIVNVVTLWIECATKSANCLLLVTRPYSNRHPKNLHWWWWWWWWWLWVVESLSCQQSLAARWLNNIHFMTMIDVKKFSPFFFLPSASEMTKTVSGGQLYSLTHSVTRVLMFLSLRYLCIYNYRW